MKIGGFQKLSLIDYPGKIASVVFTQGCNMSCSFCHNPELIDMQKPGKYTEDEILEYLDSHKQFIDAVVISGGEPTIQEDLIGFLKRLKKRDLLIKIDTNGSMPSVLKNLIDEKLVDFIAMDVKYKEYHYSENVEVSVSLSTFLTRDLIKESGIPYQISCVENNERIILEEKANVVNDERKIL